MSFAALIPIFASLLSAGGQLGSAYMNKKKGGSLLENPEKLSEFQRFDPGQQQLLDSIGSILTGKGQQPTGGILGQLFSPEGFEAYAAPARREFEESTVPKLAEQFSGGGAQRSSAFQQQLAKAGGDLSRDLGEMRARQQQNLLGPLLNSFLSPRTNQYLTPSSPTGFSQDLGQFGGMLSQGGAESGLQALLNFLSRSKQGPMGDQEQYSGIE